MRNKSCKPVTTLDDGGMLTGYRQEVVDGGDVVDGVREHAHLLLPLLLKQIHVILGHLAVGFGSQSQRCINHLKLRPIKSDDGAARAIKRSEETESA